MTRPIVEPEQTKGPQPAPELPRRVRMRTVDLIGMSLIAAIPICAAFGVFGPTSETRTAVAEAIELSVEYPTHCRYEVLERVEVRVRNRSNQTLDGVTVVFGSSWVEGFSQSSFTPTPQRVFEVDLPPLLPGETGRISGEIQGERYGRYHGRIEARTNSQKPGAEAAVDVSTIVFP